MTWQMGYSDVIFDIDSITILNFITSKSHICFPPVLARLVLHSRELLS